MKIKTIVRSTYITGSVLIAGVVIALSNPGILSADGPNDRPDYLSGGKLEYTSRVDYNKIKQETQIEALHVQVVEPYNVSEATTERLLELIGEWRAHLLRLEGGEDLRDSDGRFVANEDGTPGLTLGSIQELRDQATSQKEQAEEYLVQVEDLRASAEEARTKAELAKTRENAGFWSGQAVLYDDHADILESTAEILCGSAAGATAQADALALDAAQTKKNIADALSELDARGVDISGLDGSVSDGGASGTDDDDPLIDDDDDYLGGDDSDDDLSEFDPPDEDDSDSDESVTDDSSADVATDGSSSGGAHDDGSSGTDDDDSSIDDEDDYLGGDDSDDDLSEFDPPDEDDSDSDESITDHSSPAVVTDSSSTDVATDDSSTDGTDVDDVSVEDEQDQYFLDLQNGTSSSTANDLGIDWWDQDPIEGEWRWVRDGGGALVLDWQGDFGTLTSIALEISEAGGYGNYDPFKNAWISFPTLQEILKAEQIRLSGGLKSWMDTLDQDPGYLDYVDRRDNEDGSSVSVDDSSDSDDSAPVKVTLPEVVEDTVSTDETSDTSNDIPDPVSTPTQNDSVSLNTDNGQASNGVAVNTPTDNGEKSQGKPNAMHIALFGDPINFQPEVGLHFIACDDDACKLARYLRSWMTDSSIEGADLVQDGGENRGHTAAAQTRSDNDDARGGNLNATGPNTIMVDKLKALAANVTGPQDDDGNFLVPWVWEDIVVSPQVINGLLLIRDMHVVHLESLAAKLNNTVALPRKDKILIVRALREIAVEEVRPAYVNFRSSWSTANDWHDKHETAYGLIMGRAARYEAAAVSLRNNGLNDRAAVLEVKAADDREWAETSAWGTYLSRRLNYYQLLADNPVLGIEADGDYFYDALRIMRASDADQDYVEIFNKFLKAGAAQALEQAAEAAAITELDDLWVYGSPRYTRAQNDAVVLAKGLGVTIASGLIDAVRLQFKSAEISSEFESGVINASLGILAALAFPIPGIGPFISAGIAIGFAGAEGGRYGLTYLDELEANSTAAVTGYGQVIAAEDATREAGDSFQMAVVFAAFEIGSLQAVRLLGKARGPAQAVDDIAGAADDVADGARGLSRSDADHWIATVPDSLRGRFIAGELTELDNVVLGAQRAGLTEADIAPVLVRLRQNGANLSYGAIQAVEHELMVTLARQRGLTVMVHPETFVDFLRFAGNADLSHVRPMNLVELADIRVKALLERSGKPQFWTQAEIDLVNQVIRPAGDDAARWVSFEALQGLDPADVGLRQIFTADDLRAIDAAFDGRNLNMVPSTSPAAGGGTQRFRMEMPSAGPDTVILRMDVPMAETQIIAPRFEIRSLSGTTPRVKTQVLPRPSSGR